MLIALAFLLAIGAVQYSIRGYAVDEAYAKVGVAARQASAQFQQYMDGAFRELSVAAEGVRTQDSDVGAILTSLIDCGSFENAALIDGDVVINADGSRSPAQEPKVYIVYRRDGVGGKLMPEDGGAIQLRVPVDVQRELVGYPDGAQIDEMMLQALEGEYGYAIYNSATGKYVINKSGFDQSRYYDTLLEIDEDGSAAALMSASEAQAKFSEAGKNIYIGQCASGVQPWCIALMIPEELILEESARTVSYLRLLSGLLQAGLAIWAAVYLVRICVQERKNWQCQRRMGVELLDRIATDAAMTVCVYNCGEDRIVDFHEGFHLENGREAQPPQSIDALAMQYGVDEDDVEQLRECVRECKGGDRVELSLNASAQDGEHLLRIDMQCLADRQDCVVLRMRDCTLDMEREDVLLAEERFRKRMHGKASCIWQINISRNRWRLIDGRAPEVMRRMGIGGASWRDYMGDLAGALREYIHADDYGNYVEAMSVEGLSRLLRSDARQTTIECRARSIKNDGYEWHRMEVRGYRSLDKGELMADIYVLNVDAEKNAEMERQERARVLQQTLTAISGIYNGLYYAELDRDTCYTAKAVGGSVSSRLSQSYRGLVETFVAGDVHPEDREAIKCLLDPYQLRKRMTENSHLVRHEYRRRVGENYEMAAIIVQAARFENGTVRDIAIAMRRYTEKGSMSV